MDTESKLTWKDLGDLILDRAKSLKLDEYDHDTGQRSETELAVTYKRVSHMYHAMLEFQTAQYSCAHGRVRVTASGTGTDLDRDLAPRLVLALHALSFESDCHRADWSAHFDEPTSGMSRASARRWVNELRESPLLGRLEVT
jgi:hypothetical protein